MSLNENQFEAADQVAGGVSPVRLKTEFKATVERIHLIWLLIGNIVFLFPIGADLALLPERSLELVTGRLIGTGLSLFSYWLFRKGILDVFWFVVLPLCYFGLHFGFLLWDVPEDQVLLINTSLAGFLVGSGLVLVMKWYHYLTTSLATLVSILVFMAFSESLSLEVLFFNGGVLVLGACTLATISGQLRYRSQLKILKTQLALEDSTGLLDEKNQLLRETNQLLEDKVALRTASLQKSNEERDAVVYRLSHDFKNPMINVRSLSEMAQREKDPAKLERIFLMIDDSLNRFEGLVNGMDQFVVYSREEHIEEATELHRLIHKNWSRVLKELPVDMELKMEEGPEIQVHTDPEKLSLVLKAIMRNAILFQAADEKSELVVSFANAKNGISISLKDNGTGISQDVLHKVTDLFYRGDRRSKGLGLGLYLAKFTLLQIGGELEISSSADGTDVKIWIPNQI